MPALGRIPQVVHVTAALAPFAVRARRPACRKQIDPGSFDVVEVPRWL